MVSQLPANVNLSTLLSLAPASTPTGVEPIETVQTGTSCALTLNQILQFAQANFTVAGLSVLGNIGTASASAASITGITDQVLRVAHNGTSLGFGAINLATSAAVTGQLTVPFGGSGTSTLTANAVLFGGTSNTATLQFAAATTAGFPLVSNGSASAGSFQAINLASTFVTGTLGTGNGGVGTSTVGQLPATSTNDSASAGKVGEYTSTSVVSGSARALSSATQTSVTSLSLSPGDWDVWGAVVFKGTATTTISYILASISAVGSTSSGTVGDAETRVTMPGGTLLFGGLTDGYVVNVGQVQQSLAATTTVWLTCQASIGTSTCSAYGTFKARRRR